MTIEESLAKTIAANLSLHKTNIAGHELRYIKAGSGPAVLLLHGGNIGWGQWYPNIGPLAKHFSVYALDLPGGGRSSRVDFFKINLEKDLVDVVDTFIEQQKFEDLHIIGSSNGGWIALKLALRKKPQIRKLVIADSVGLSNYVGIMDRIIGFNPMAKFLARTVFKPKRENKQLEKLLRSTFANHSVPLQKEFIDYFYETTETSHNIHFISRLINETCKRKMSLREHLPLIPHETLIIWGEKDKLMPLKKFMPSFSGIRNVKTHIIKDAGHIPSLEKPDEFNKTVIDFLAASSKI